MRSQILEENLLSPSQTIIIPNKIQSISPFSHRETNIAATCHQRSFLQHSPLQKATAGQHADNGDVWYPVSTDRYTGNTTLTLKAQGLLRKKGWKDYKSQRNSWGLLKIETILMKCILYDRDAWQCHETGLRNWDKEETSKKQWTGDRWGVCFSFNQNKDFEIDWCKFATPKIWTEWYLHINKINSAVRTRRSWLHRSPESLSAETDSLNDDKVLMRLDFPPELQAPSCLYSLLRSYALPCYMCYICYTCTILR